MIEKQLSKYLFPNMLAMFGISIYILADTLFISIAAGSNGITALNLTLPIFGIIFALGALIGVGFATNHTLKKTSNDSDKKLYFSHAISWCLSIGLIFSIIGIFNTENVLRIMGADNTILEVGYTYTRTILLFAPVFMLNYTFTTFVRNDNAPKIAMMAVILSSLFNVIFDYIFMFILDFGLFGAALATGISPIISMLVCLVHYKSKNNTIIYKIQKPNINKLKQSYPLGISAFVGEVSSGITTLVFNFLLLGLVGNIAVAAYGVVANVALVIIAIFNGIAQGLQPMASHYESKSDMNAKKRIKNYSLKIGIILSILMVIFIWNYADKIVNVFNSENSLEMYDYGVIGLKLYSLGFIIAVVNIINAGYYSAIGKAKESSLISISRGIVSIIFFAFVLSHIYGIYGVWIAFLVSEVFTYIISVIYRYNNIRNYNTINLNEE